MNIIVPGLTTILTVCNSTSLKGNGVNKDISNHVDWETAAVASVPVSLGMLKALNAHAKFKRYVSQLTCPEEKIIMMTGGSSFRW